jgi:hypothetical protein
MGYDVVTCPETPTLLMSAGFRYPGEDGGPLLLEFEHALLKLQMHLEDNVRSLAAARDALQAHRPCVVICDRGILDMKAYMPPPVWAALLAKAGVTEAAIVARYDLVVHLVTAADGAEAYYTRANNATRTETAEQARELDRRVARTWGIHPRRAVVGNNYPSFGGKMAAATAEVVGYLMGAAGGGGGSESHAAGSGGGGSGGAAAVPAPAAAANM